MGTGGDAEGGRVVGERPPEGAILHALACIILSKRVIRTLEDAGSSGIFGVGPRIGRTRGHAGLRGVIGKRAWICYIANYLRIGADCHAGLAEHIRVGKQIPGAVLHASACVVICELSLNRNVLGAGRLALSSHVAGPSAQGASVGAVVAYGRSDGAGRDASVCVVVGEEVWQSRADRHTLVSGVIRIFPSLAIAV